MKKVILATLKGIGTGISAILLWLFPTDRHTWSAKDEISELKVNDGKGLGHLAGPLQREVFRIFHGWAPPLPAEKLPVDD